MRRPRSRGHEHPGQHTGEGGKASGGLALVQDPEEATIARIPLAALLRGHPDMDLTADRLAAQVACHCGRGTAAPDGSTVTELAGS